MSDTEKTEPTVTSVEIVKDTDEFQLEKTTWSDGKERVRVIPKETKSSTRKDSKVKSNPNENV